MTTWVTKQGRRVSSSPTVCTPPPEPAVTPAESGQHLAASVRGEVQPIAASRGAAGARGDLSGAELTSTVFDSCAFLGCTFEGSRRFGAPPDGSRPPSGRSSGDRR